MKSLLFSDPMIQALRDRRKTQTRRMVRLTADDGEQRDHTKWQLETPEGKESIRETASRPPWPPKRAFEFWWWNTDDSRGIYEYAPIMPGEVFYAREAWCDRTGFDASPKLFFRADNEHQAFESDAFKVRWRSPLHLRAEDARFHFRCTAVRVERLNDISEEDANAEGVTVAPDACVAAVVAGEPWTPAKMEFWALWKLLHGAMSWDANPWVWVYTFEQITREEAFAAEGKR